MPDPLIISTGMALAKAMTGPAASLALEVLDRVRKVQKDETADEANREMADRMDQLAQRLEDLRQKQRLDHLSGMEALKAFEDMLRGLREAGSAVKQEALVAAAARQFDKDAGEQPMRRYWGLEVAKLSDAEVRLLRLIGSGVLFFRTIEVGNEPVRFVKMEAYRMTMTQWVERGGIPGGALPLHVLNLRHEDAFGFADLGKTMVEGAGVSPDRHLIRHWGGWSPSADSSFFPCFSLSARGQILLPYLGGEKV